MVKNPLWARSEVSPSIWCFTMQTCSFGVCFLGSVESVTGGDTQRTNWPRPILKFFGMISGYMTINQQQHIKIPRRKLPTSKSTFWFLVKGPFVKILPEAYSKVYILKSCGASSCCNLFNS